jgi:hypothetical protein
VTGFEATQKIRKMPEFDTKRVVIIAMSASVFEADQQQSMIVGCDGFLPKPVNLMRLLTVLETHLELEWVYDEEQRGAGVEEQGEPGFLPSHLLASLVPPPPEELEVLLDLALRGSIEKIRDRTVQIERLDQQYRPFASKLRELAEMYDVEAILTLIEQCMGAGKISRASGEV